ncbi:MAG TPA: hypothetical protein VGE24_07495, partial [Emticicia sp.]
MQFKYLTKEENIKCYTISNDKIALLLKDGSFYYDNENLVRAVDGFFFHDNFLYYSQDGVSTIILNTRTKERTNIPKIFSSDSVEANSFLIGNNYERFGDTLYYSAEIELYQLNPYKLINRLAKRYIFSKYIRRNNYLFTEKFKTILSSLSLLTGEYEWEI